MQTSINGTAGRICTYDNSFTSISSMPNVNSSFSELLVTSLKLSAAVFGGYSCISLLDLFGYEPRAFTIKLSTHM